MCFITNLISFPYYFPLEQDRGNNFPSVYSQPYIQQHHTGMLARTRMLWKHKLKKMLLIIHTDLCKLISNVDVLIASASGGNNTLFTWHSLVPAQWVLTGKHLHFTTFNTQVCSTTAQSGIWRVEQNRSCLIEKVVLGLPYQRCEWVNELNSFN